MEQYGSRNRHCCPDLALNQTLIFDISRMKRWAMALLPFDASQCYDRMHHVPTHHWPSVAPVSLLNQSTLPSRLSKKLDTFRLQHTAPQPSLTVELNAAKLDYNHLREQDKAVAKHPLHTMHQVPNRSRSCVGWDLHCSFLRHLH